MELTPFAVLVSSEFLTSTILTFVEQAGEHAASHLFAQHGRKLLPQGTTASWEEVPFHRGLAPVTGPESPHPQVARLGREKRHAAMCSIRLYKDLLSGQILPNRFNSPEELALSEKAYMLELQDLATLIANTREYLAAGALLGRIEVSERTIPGSDLALEIEFGNRRAVALTSWSDPNTGIRSAELLRLKRIYKDEAGRDAGVVLTEPGVERHLLTNRELRGYVMSALGAEVLQNLDLSGIPPQWDGLAGLRFWFTDGSYKPEGRPITRYFPEDTLVVLPPLERLSSVLGWAEGIELTLKGHSFGLPLDVTKHLELTRGFYAYAHWWTDPPGIRIYAGWTGLPVILDPSSVLVYRTRALAGVP